MIDGKAFTESHEGRRLKVYIDTTKHRSIAVGFNLDAVGARSTMYDAVPDVDFDAVYSGAQEMTDEQVDDLYAYTYDRARLAAGRQVRSFAGLADEVKAVVIDMVFNLGEYGFSQFKRLRDALSNGDRSSAAKFMQQSLWFSQVGSRAVENIALMRPASERSAPEAELAQKWGVTA